MGGRLTLHGTVDDLRAQYDGLLQMLAAQPQPETPDVTSRKLPLTQTLHT